MVIKCLGKGWVGNLKVIFLNKFEFIGMILIIFEIKEIVDRWLD